jgi:hypothetical protein
LAIDRFGKSREGSNLATTSEELRASINQAIICYDGKAFGELEISP